MPTPAAVQNWLGGTRPSTRRKRCSLHVILKWKPNSNGEWHVIGVFLSSNGRMLDNRFVAAGVPLPMPVCDEVERIIRSSSPPQALRSEWEEFVSGSYRFGVTTLTPQASIRFEM